MRTTVVVFVPIPDGEMSEEQLAVGETQPTQRSIAVDGPMPPLWTWFIENPRPVRLRQN
jgi:hypothetical protein